MSHLPIDKQVKFLEQELNCILKGWNDYLETLLCDHFAKGTAYAGRVTSLDRQGNLLIRFKKDRTPRLNMSVMVFTFKAHHLMVESPAEWNLSYSDFRREAVISSSQALPIYYLQKEDPDWVWMGFSGVEVGFSDKVGSLVGNGVFIPVVIGEDDPPFKYLQNLLYYTQSFPEDPLLHLDLSRKDMDAWRPENYGDAMSLEGTLIKALNDPGTVLVQGPPGTGKSHLIASLVRHFCARHFRVAKCALANKALVEVAEKPGLRDLVSDEKLSKTGLSGNESRGLPGLQLAKELGVPPGHVLLSTFYKLSDKLIGLPLEDDENKPFDLLVMEEASQAFLTTISGFSRLAHRVLVVGDPIQLPPHTCNNKEVLETIHRDLPFFVTGMAALGLNASMPAYRLTGTWRLLHPAVRLTGIFYQDSLHSIAQHGAMPVQWPELFGQRPTPEHGVILCKADLLSNNQKEKDVLNGLMRYVKAFLEANTSTEVAVLTGTKQELSSLQKAFGVGLGNQRRLLIETVDRVQGLTVDLVIAYLPGRVPWFEFQLNRFNVATSRARFLTVLVVGMHTNNVRGMHHLVRNFLSACPSINC